ncbi:MAG: enoyl-CoA hydratase-related protein [Planctomycetota bacterium]
MTRPTIQCEDRGAVRLLTITNPERRNALTRGLLGELVAALPSAPPGADQPIRAVVLTGAKEGRCFSSGFDLFAVDEAERARGLDPIDEPARAIECAPVPVIAAIYGAAFGGALELACACDFRLAEFGTRLCMPPAKIGLVYSQSGLERFLRLIPAGAARQMFLTGAPIGAEQALTIGLVEEVFPTGEAVPAALAQAEAIAANAPLSIAGIRASLRALGAPPPLAPEEKTALSSLRAAALSSADLQEGVRAFRDKRAPRFEGR